MARKGNVKFDAELAVTESGYWSYSLGKPTKIYSKFRFWIKLVLNKYLLSPFGLQIVAKTSLMRLEQKSYICSDMIVNKRNIEICNSVLSHFKTYGFLLDKEVCLEAIDSYQNLFNSLKISSLEGGMGFNNGLILYLIIKNIHPKNVLESGVWRGYTTKIIDHAISADAKIRCHDINLSRLEYVSTKAEYYESDIDLSDTTPLAFDFALFDDHVSHYDRINYCIKNGINAAVFDDDVSINQVHSDGWPPIPTASMIFDFNNIPKKFNWISNFQLASADINGIDVKKIKESYRRIEFPLLQALTGYPDTSVSSLLLSSANKNEDC